MHFILAIYSGLIELPLPLHCSLHYGRHTASGGGGQPDLVDQEQTTTFPK